MTVSSVLPVLRDALLDEGAAGAESITEWHLRCLAAYLRGGPSPRSCLLYDLRSGSLDACHAAALAEDRERATAEWFRRRLLRHRLRIASPVTIRDAMRISLR